MEFNLKEFRFSKLNNKEYKHLYYLLFWLVYGFFYFLLEKLEFTHYYDVAKSIDRMIPFCEYFVFFYFFWYLYMTYVIVYVFFCDIESFKKFSRFAIITYSVAIISYFIFPTMQSLRPTEFARDNIFVDIVKGLYAIDTPTNVCPSVHVIGTVSALLTIWNAKGHKKPWIRILFLILGILIISSTLFLKQHGIIDIIMGLIVCSVAYFIVFFKK